VAIRKVKKSELYKSLVGDLRLRISFFDRTMVPSSSSISSAFVEKYTNEISRWASHESIHGKHYFNDINLKDNPSTDKFIIRYDTSINAEKVIKFNDIIFKINNIINPQKRNQFLIIYCHEDGPDTKEANT